MSDHICPECNGAGLVNVIWAGLPESVADATDCPCCRGDGRISTDHKLRLDRGQAKRKARVAAGKSLAEAARECGITTREMGDIEWGRP